MKYGSKTVEKANGILADRRKAAETQASERKEAFIKEHPEYAEIDRQLTQSGLDAVKAIMGCSDPRKYIEELKRKNLDCQKAKASFLKSCGFDEDYLEPHYSCKKCNDTGICNGEICDCYSRLLKQLSFNELSNRTPLIISGFEDFDVSLYSDSSARQKMGKILEFCKQYAEDFDTQSDSIFMYGETGLGKTHLSLAIAGKAIEKGFGVIYGSAHSLFSELERERFGRSDNADGTTEEKLTDCDLLIIDDLGAEFSTQFTVAALYNIINIRMSKELPTIINTNVSLNELEKLYTNRITSRIIGNYKLLHFIGNDIRQVKR